MNIIQIAESQIGVKEYPTNSNKVKYNTWYYGRVVSGPAYPWCAVFVAWCFLQAGEYERIKGVQNKAYCPSYVAWAKREGRWKQTPKAGFLVLFDWDGDGVADHIGIVERGINATTVQTIEGNTGTQSQNNGGEVMRRQRNVAYILGYIDTGASATKKTAPAKLAIDGKFGTASVLKLQKWLGTTQDGIISGQGKSDKKHLPNLTAVEYDKGTGSEAIKALQKALNKAGAKLAVDGCMGAKTIKALQKWLNGKQKAYNLAIDGYFGPATAKALQTYLNGVK